MAFHKISSLLLVSPLPSTIKNVVLIWLFRGKEERLCVELLYYNHEFHGAVAATRAWGPGPAPSELGWGLAIDQSEGWIRPWVRLLEKNSWNSQCSYVGDIHLEAQQTGAKGISSPSIQAAILTLCSTAIHSWHSNTMKMGVVNMSS